MANAHLIKPLSRSIEDVRMELNDSAAVHPLSSPHIIMLSQRLDHLLNQYENLSNN
ncbi:aspartyl-phosphate phosphatase Spo0E family protein [Bacillus sp. JCM 19041]|uniref:aspartyl-phosphate phosphatase Spo0E family protein n=1 Tax=Bacillus sp. JCM 19041 TaxID=1460637 RepID=UPI0009E9EA55